MCFLRNFFTGSSISIAGLFFLVGCQAVILDTPKPEITFPSPTVASVKTEEPKKLEEPTPTEEIIGEKVIFTTEDHVRLAGTLFGDGEIAVILAHQGTPTTDQVSWYPFAQVLADEGFTALTFDFRGKGDSFGMFEAKYLINDLNSAIAFLRDHGYEKIICVGASMGGTACLRAALDDDLIGLVVFASTLLLSPPTYVRPAELADLNLPKLFITAENDVFVVTKDINKMYNDSPEPKELYIFEGLSEHGTDLFDTNVGDELTNFLLTFIKGLVN